MKGLKKQITIQAIRDSNKYLITVGNLKDSTILTKDELIVWLEKRLSG